MNNKFYYGIIISHLVIAIFILPTFNKGKDFFIFSKWSLYDRVVYKVYDISWDNRTTYMLRDHIFLFKEKYNLSSVIFKSLYSNDLSWFESNRKLIKKFCNCNKFYKYELKGQISDHILFKKNMTVLNKIEL